MKSIPKKLLASKSRKEMWKNAKRITQKLEKILPIEAVYVRGSFTTKKKRPADVDFIILLKEKTKNKKARWSVDFVITPNNKYGKEILEDADLWMKQKYGTKNLRLLKIK